MFVKIDCPYCEVRNEFEIWSEDYSEDEPYHHECESCDKIFGVNMNFSWDYDSDAEKLPCANGEGCKKFSRSFGHSDGPKKICEECGKKYPIN